MTLQPKTRLRGTRYSWAIVCPVEAVSFNVSNSTAPRARFTSVVAAVQPSLLFFLQESVILKNPVQNPYNRIPKRPQYTRHPVGLGV